MGGSVKNALLRDKIIDALVQQLDADATPAAALRRYMMLAEDYRSLERMDEIPRHADPALAAWRQIAPAATGLPQRALLALIADAYERVVDDRRSQSGQ